MRHLHTDWLKVKHCRQCDTETQHQYKQLPRLYTQTNRSWPIGTDAHVRGSSTRPHTPTLTHWVTHLPMPTLPHTHTHTLISNIAALTLLHTHKHTAIYAVTQQHSQCHAHILIPTVSYTHVLHIATHPLLHTHDRTQTVTHTHTRIHIRAYTHTCNIRAHTHTCNTPDTHYITNTTTHTNAHIGIQSHTRQQHMPHAIRQHLGPTARVTLLLDDFACTPTFVARLLHPLLEPRT